MQMTWVPTFLSSQMYPQGTGAFDIVTEVIRICPTTHKPMVVKCKLAPVAGGYALQSIQYQ